MTHISVLLLLLLHEIEQEGDGDNIDDYEEILRWTYKRTKKGKTKGKYIFATVSCFIVLLCSTHRTQETFSHIVPAAEHRKKHIATNFFACCLRKFFWNLFFWVCKVYFGQEIVLLDNSGFDASPANLCGDFQSKSILNTNFVT